MYICDERFVHICGISFHSDVFAHISYLSFHTNNCFTVLIGNRNG